MRVMTWNLWWRFGDWRDRLAAIRAVLAEERPDILALQEVWADDSMNQAEWLAGELGMRFVYGAPTEQRRWRDRVKDQTVSYGIAVLSRWPMRDDKFFDLPADPSRPMLSVMIEAPHAVVPVVATHLSVVGGTARRLEQLSFVAAHVAALPDTEHPPVVMGDFNAEPDSDEVRRFAGHKTVGFVDDLVLLDAWCFADHGDPGSTWDRANPYVADWIEPSSRIDYIHVVGSASRFGRVSAVRRAGAGPVDGVWPSDHAAVVADLS